MYRVVPTKLANKDLRALYGISCPTFRRWLRRAGLDQFIGRRKFLAREVVQIFEHLGRPQLARKAAQRLKDIYAHFSGRPTAEQEFEQRTGQVPPKLRQDRLPKAKEEQDAAQIQVSTHPVAQLSDALARLTIVSIKIRGMKARKQELQPREVTDTSLEYGRRPYRFEAGELYYRGCSFSCCSDSESIVTLRGSQRISSLKKQKKARTSLYALL